MKPNLVSELRTDRNGKTVTRWVKPTTQQNTKSFPPPAAEQSPLTTYPELFQEFRNALKNPDLSIPEYIDYAVVRIGLEDLPQHTLSYLDSVLKNNPDNNYLISTVISAIHKGIPASAIDDCAYLYANVDHNYFNPDTYTGWDHMGFDGLSIATSTLRGCGLTNVQGLDYSYGFVRPMRLQDDNTADKVLALFNTLNAMQKLDREDTTYYNNEEAAEYLTDPALAQLVVDHHANNPELLQAIKDRDTIDPDTLRAILDHGESALRSGVL